MVMTAFLLDSSHNLSPKLGQVADFFSEASSINAMQMSAHDTMLLSGVDEP